MKKETVKATAGCYESSLGSFFSDGLLQTLLTAALH